MNRKRIFIFLVFVCLFTINISNTTYGKYVIQDIKEVVDINIDNICPKLEILSIENSNTELKNIANKDDIITIKLEIKDINLEKVELENRIKIYLDNQHSKTANIIIKLLKDKKDSRTYEIIVNNIEGNGLLYLKIDKDSISDKFKNKNEEIYINTHINIENIAYNIINYGVYDVKNGWDLGHKDGEIAGGKIEDTNYQISSIAYCTNDKVEKDFVKIEPIYSKTTKGIKTTKYTKYIVYNNNKYFTIQKQKENFICGIKVNLKEYDKYSVIYQILNKNGWMDVETNGKATKNEKEPLIALRIKIVDGMKKQKFIEDWNKEIKVKHKEKR